MGSKKNRLRDVTRHVHDAETSRHQIARLKHHVHAGTGEDAVTFTNRAARRLRERTSQDRRTLVADIDGRA